MVLDTDRLKAGIGRRTSTFWDLFLVDIAVVVNANAKIIAILLAMASIPKGGSYINNVSGMLKFLVSGKLFSGRHFTN